MSLWPGGPRAPFGLAATRRGERPGRGPGGDRAALPESDPGGWHWLSAQRMKEIPAQDLRQGRASRGFARIPAEPAFVPADLPPAPSEAPRRRPLRSRLSNHLRGVPVIHLRLRLSSRGVRARRPRLSRRLGVGGGFKVRRGRPPPNLPVIAPRANLRASHSQLGSSLKHELSNYCQFRLIF